MPDGSLDHYEKQVKQDRDALAASLETLSRTMEPTQLKSEVSATVEAYGRQLWTVARDNPAACALLGIGATLLVSGLGHRSRTDGHVGSNAVPPNRAMDGFDERVAAADDAIKRQEVPEPVVQPASASRMRATLRNGLDRLPPDARRRVLAARLSALRLQERLEHRARSATAQTAKAVRDHPTEAAALAFGLGVLGAAFAPSTEAEDKLLGAERDALMQSARDALKKEMEGLRTAAQNSRAKASEAAPTVPS